MAEKARGQIVAQQSDALSSAIDAVKREPANDQHWELVEELVDTAQRPSDVRELFRTVLNQNDLKAEVASLIGQRAVRFYESWYGDEQRELAELLHRVFERDNSADWAFERLTVALTVAERWTDLLNAYDQAIARADQTARRMKLLDEAAQVAKDFAAQPDRAIGYMSQLFALDPDNLSLAASLERLLERQGRFRDLIALWGSRIELQPQRQQRDTRLRMASCYVDSLADYRSALIEIEKARRDAPEYKPTLDLLERILGADAAGATDRRIAREHLKEHFSRQQHPHEVVRVLEASLAFVTGDERVAQLRELVDRSLALPDDSRAMQHQAALLLILPNASERDALRRITERTRDFERYAGFLVQAARSAEPGLRVEFLMEAARLSEEQLGQLPEAIGLYQEVFADADGETTIAAGRRLVKLLEQTDRERETLDALSRMCELEPVEATRKTMLGKVAQLADKLGDKERARKAWSARVGDDSGDLEALDALVASATRDGDYQALARLLHQRANATKNPQARRADLGRLAKVSDEQLQDPDAAIETWRRVQSLNPDDSEAVTRLTDLLGRTARWAELAEVLSQAAQREVTRFTELQTQLGDAYRTRLEKPEQAVLRYRTALQVDPRHAGAREGQTVLIGHEPSRAVAVGSLAEAYQQTGEWQNTLGLLEPQLASARNDAERAEILVEAARIYESRAQDPERALTCYRRAFALMPDERSTEREIRRLAESLDQWHAVVTAYRDTLCRLDKASPRAAELHHEQGIVLEERLHDREAALTAYVEAARIRVDRADFARSVARLSGRLGQFRVAAEQVVQHAAAEGKCNEALLATLEQVAEQVSGFDALCIALSEVTTAHATEVPASVSRELHARVAILHRDRRRDLHAAESSFLRALRAEPGHAPTLSALADVQRAEPSAELVNTLRSLADADPEQLDVLWEAAEVAADHARDRQKLATTLEALHQRAIALWRRGKKPAGKHDSAAAVAFAVERLVGLHEAEAEHARSLQLLTEAASLPFDAAHKQRFLHRAAALCSGPLSQPARAIELYRDVLTLDPRDESALSALGQLYAQLERLPELIMLRRHELELTTDGDRKLELRLGVAALVGEVEARGDRIGALQLNLAERPGHKPSLDALGALLRQKGQHVELAAIFETQARTLRGRQRESEAAWLYRQVAELHEGPLRDVAAALSAYRELHALEPHGDASEALARLHAGRGEFAQAAEWLEIRLASVAPELRASTAIALARAQQQAGQPARARGCLEQALAIDPSVDEARDLLAQLYRDEAAHEPLARLLAQGAELIGDPGRRLEYLREAADLYHDQLSAPDRAIPVLQRATELAPDDLRLRIMLAEGLHVARRYDEARGVLQALIDGYGRKRTPERADLHYRLGRVCESAGLIEEAFAELELASKMDLGHQGALHALARLAHAQNDLERAERAYRGLLLLVRRHKADGDSLLAPSEVFYELYRIALARNQTDTASELLASASESAAQSDSEAQRFSALLKQRGETELLLRVLDARMQSAREPHVQAEIMAAKAEALEAIPARAGEALELRLSSLELAPHDDALHAAALAQAERQAELSRYTDALTQLAEDAQRARTPAGARSAALLTLRLGRVIEERLGNLDHAAGLYARVEASGECVVDAWFAMARVAGARGDRAEQRRVLTRIGALDDQQADKAARDEARFLLAELELAEEQTRDEGLESLARALEDQPDYGRAKACLMRVLNLAPDHVGVLALFERVARGAHDDAMLLELVERRSLLAGAPLGVMREGIELALRMQALDRAEVLLQRAAEQVRAQGAMESAEQAALATWIMSGLAECRLQAHDTRAAMTYLREAIRYAAPTESEALLRELAQLATGADGDLGIAAEAYDGLLERDPAERALWEPMLDVLTQLGDPERMRAFVERTLGALSTQAERMFLLLTYAGYLIDVANDEQSAVPVLRQALEEEPGNLIATDRLLAIYQKYQLNAELAELLQQQFDRARDERNVPAITELGLRLGAAYQPNQRDVAADTFRAALEWDPEHRGLLAALLEALPDDADVRDRAELSLRLLRSETGHRAATLANYLADTFSNLGDDDRAIEALELGHRAEPEDDELTERLIALYTERESWRPLAELLMGQAQRAGQPEDAVARLKQVAALYRERLDDVDASAEALRAALAISPDDASLLAEHARNLAAAGKHEAAIEDVGRLIDAHPAADERRAELLRVRADLCLEAGATVQAVNDLHEAYQIAPAAVVSALIEALEALRGQCREQGDVETGRIAVLHLVAVLDETEQSDRARDVLAEWADEAPNDTEVLRALRSRDARQERWGDVAAISARLIDVEEGEARVEAALGMADACEQLGQPEEALAALQRVFESASDSAALRARLRESYERMGEKRQLAALLSGDAELAPDTSDKLTLLLRAAELFFEVGEASLASEPLSRALELAPDDDRVRLMLVDLHMSLAQIDEATSIVDAIVNNPKRKRSPELAMFQQRMARISAQRGDGQGQLRWLNTALETDRKSGEIASELAEASIAIEDYDTAMKALRTLTMMEDPRPITRALAFLKQAQIAVMRGDVQRAQHWARKAKSLDETLPEVDEFLERIGG